MVGGVNSEDDIKRFVKLGVFALVFALAWFVIGAAIEADAERRALAVRLG